MQAAHLERQKDVGEAPEQREEPDPDQQQHEAGEHQHDENGFLELRAVERAVQAPPEPGPDDREEALRLAEIGLARSLNHPEVETLSLRDDPLLLVGPRKQSPTHARRARLEQVAGWPLIFYERGSSDWTLTHSLFRRAGLVPNIALEVDTIETAKRMVDRGLGMAFLPQLAVGQEIRSGKLATVKILDAEPLGRSLDVIHPRHRPLRKEAQAFLQVIREAVKESSTIRERSHRGRRRWSR